MNRRHALATAGSLGVAACTGCVDHFRDGTADSGDRDLAIDGEEPTFDHRPSGTVVVEATAIKRLAFEPHCRTVDAIYFLVDDATVEPVPTERETDSRSPVWTWERREDVTVTVPVGIADDAAPGSCEYAVTASDGEEALERRYRVTSQ